uniref:Uncharacterized protein n=1 Tax=Micrurus surinamensis TaxID=129470 RepID=A0A2D4NNT1_MICSU
MKDCCWRRIPFNLNKRGFIGARSLLHDLGKLYTKLEAVSSYFQCYNSSEISGPQPSGHRRPVPWREVFPWTRGIVVLCAASIPQMGLCLFAQPGLWHAVTWCLSMDQSWGCLTYKVSSDHTIKISVFGNRHVFTRVALSKVMELLFSTFLVRF